MTGTQLCDGCYELETRVQSDPDKATRILATLPDSAVAELIEAIKENRAAMEAFAQDGMPSNYIRFDQSERRLLKALDRVGGAK